MCRLGNPLAEDITLHDPDMWRLIVVLTRGSRILIIITRLLRFELRLGRYGVPVLMIFIVEGSRGVC